eukprot:EG_transcript_30036
MSAGSNTAVPGELPTGAKAIGTRVFRPLMVRVTAVIEAHNRTRNRLDWNETDATGPHVASTRLRADYSPAAGWLSSARAWAWTQQWHRPQPRRMLTRFRVVQP